MSKRHYLAYLVRLWLEEGDGRTTWRASIEDPHTAEQRGFSDLSRLFEYLRRQTEVWSNDPNDPNDQESIRNP